MYRLSGLQSLTKDLPDVDSVSRLSSSDSSLSESELSEAEPSESSSVLVLELVDLPARLGLRSVRSALKKGPSFNITYSFFFEIILGGLLS